MPRIRTIKPELPQDVKLASASRDARYTFVLLISQADDDGLIPGAHRQLLGLLYPHDEDVTSAMLLTWVEELVAVGVLRWRTTNDGAPVIEITNWSKHQRVDNKGRSSFAGILAPFDPNTPPPRKSAIASELPQNSESRGISPRLAAVRRLEGEGDLGVGVGGGPGEPAAVAAKVIRVVPPTPDVDLVLAHYVRLHPRRRPGPKDRKTVARALGYGYSAPELCEALDGNASDPWHVEKKKHELSYVLRDNGQIDNFRDKAAAHTEKPFVVDGWFAA